MPVSPSSPKSGLPVELEPTSSPATIAVIKSVKKPKATLRSLADAVRKCGHGNEELKTVVHGLVATTLQKSKVPSEVQTVIVNALLKAAEEKASQAQEGVAAEQEKSQLTLKGHIKKMAMSAMSKKASTAEVARTGRQKDYLVRRSLSVGTKKAERTQRWLTNVSQTSGSKSGSTTPASHQNRSSLAAQSSAQNTAQTPTKPRRAASLPASSQSSIPKAQTVSHVAAAKALAERLPVSRTHCPPPSPKAWASSDQAVGINALSGWLEAAATSLVSEPGARPKKMTAKEANEWASHLRDMAGQVRQMKNVGAAFAHVMSQLGAHLQ